MTVIFLWFSLESKLCILEVSYKDTTSIFDSLEYTV